MRVKDQNLDFVASLLRAIGPAAGRSGSPCHLGRIESPWLRVRLTVKVKA